MNTRQEVTTLFGVTSYRLRLNKMELELRDERELEHGETAKGRANLRNCSSHGNL